VSPFSAPFFWGTQNERPLLPIRATAFREGHKKSSVGFQKISWEEAEKQKARRCRAQEFGPKHAQENERQKKGGLPNSEGSWGHGAGRA